MPLADWQDRNYRLCAHLREVILAQHPQTILAYFSIRQEPDLTPLWRQTKDPANHYAHRWGFPRCEGKHLHWHQWLPGTPLRSGAFGLAEPDADAPPLSASEVDLMLVPAVACDRRGYRLGYGGGFYDRILSDPSWAAIPTIGITFDFAYLPSLPTDPWDMPLTGVCTETGLHWV